MKRACIAVVPLAAALALTGCAGQPSPEPVGTNSPHSSTPTHTHTPTQTSQTDAPIDNATPIPVPEAGADGQESAIAAAEKVVARFAQSALSAEEWMEQMTPLLSPTGYDAYTGIDPAQIPVHQVTGAGRNLPASTDVSLIVHVPTDVGSYNVTLTRRDVSVAWLAERIRPTQG